MSLRLRAVLIAGISLAVLWGIAAAFMMKNVQTNLERTLDGRLAMSARMVAGLLERSALPRDIANENWRDAVEVSGSEGIACEIRLLQGQIIARTDTGPYPFFELEKPGLSTRNVDGQTWRIYILHSGYYQITTADRIDQRETLLHELLYTTGIPFLIAFLGGLAMLWIGIGQGLTPLDILCRELRNRSTEDATPIDIHKSPSEVRPLLTAMNDLIARLARALSSQRAFTDAAAHELRTPLTVIDTHLQVFRLTTGEEADTSLANAEKGVRRLRHTLDQMMLLARADATVSVDDSCDSILSVVNHVTSHICADEKYRLSIHINGTDCGTPIPASMLETAIRNLVDNALRYSPTASPVELHLDFEAAASIACIKIIDQGPGLGEEEITRIGRRFWRADSGRKKDNGAGLGISIVQAIVNRFYGNLSWTPRKDGGLIATLRVPLK